MTVQPVTLGVLAIGLPARAPTIGDFLSEERACCCETCCDASSAGHGGHLSAPSAMVVVHLDYLPRRLQDIVRAVFIFLGPIWTRFIIYEKYPINPKAVLDVAGIFSALWMLLVVFLVASAGNSLV
jgi:hypothetical protein